jgi:hypothetical protein
MRIIKKVLFLLVSLSLTYSCKEVEAFPEGNSFYFSEPQPINDSEINSFPNKFLGLYVNEDSIYVNISKKYILKESYFKFRIHVDSLDVVADELVQINGKYIFNNKETFHHQKRIGDSIEFTDKRVDTFFVFSNNQKAKRISGKLVLSERDSIFWQSKLVYLDKENLVIKYLYSDDDLRKMDSITKIKSKQLDSTSYLISPSRAEFKRFFEIKNLGYESKYRKVKK